MRRQPRAAQHERRPPRVRRRARSRTPRRRSSITRPPAMKSIEIDSGGPVMPRSKSRATVRSPVSAGVLEMPHAGWAHARRGEPIVEPRARAVAQVRARGLVNGREDLQEDEHRADEREGGDQAVAVLDRGDERAHRDREHRRQRAAQDEHRPPGGRQRAVGPGQNREELPFLARAQLLDHGCLPGVGEARIIRKRKGPARVSLPALLSDFAQRAGLKARPTSTRWSSCRPACGSADCHRGPSTRSRQPSSRLRWSAFRSRWSGRSGLPG